VITVSIPVVYHFRIHRSSLALVRSFESDPILVRFAAL